MMPVSLILLILVLVAAVSVALFVHVSERQRREVLLRADARDTAYVIPERPVTRAGAGTRLLEWVLRRTPSSWADKPGVRDRLVHAGYDSPLAPAVYVLARLGFAIGAPALALLLVPRTNERYFLLALLFAAAVGLLAPRALLDRTIERRQVRLRRALPDALDLLIVCVESGVSLDAAILRVAREMSLLHPELAEEFAIVNRKSNAGMPREQALHGLWTRTGVEELRALSSSMIQSERWGTSITTVLRVYAETLRRKRMQLAEKKGAEASLKMLFPVVLFILPVLFIIVLGPALLNVGAIFGSVGK